MSATKISPAQADATSREYAKYRRVVDVLGGKKMAWSRTEFLGRVLPWLLGKCESRLCIDRGAIAGDVLVWRGQELIGYGPDMYAAVLMAADRLISLEGA